MITNFCTRAIALSSSLLVTAGAGQASETFGSAPVGGDAMWVLAGGFVIVGLFLRRRVNAGIWSSREKAFARRNQALARGLNRPSTGRRSA